jgi:N-acetylmuramoyl-L-alanine amidase
LRFFALLAVFLFAAPVPLFPQAASNINLNATLQQWSFEREPSRSTNPARWKSQWNRIEVERDKSFFTLNGSRVWLGAPVSENNGTYLLRRADLDNTLVPLLYPRSTPAAPVARVRHVLLDPGHGGKDTGGRNPRLGIDEKTVSFDVARRVKFILEKQGFQVTLTRTQDTFVELSDRVAMAKKIRADLFVCIHFNTAADASSANGIETYVLTPQGQHSTNDAASHSASAAQVRAREIGHQYGPWNTLLGYQVHTSLTRKLGADDRGLRRARFHVLRDAACPAVLVECGFLSNAAESARISTGAHREKIAQGIADGILRYRQITDQLTAPAPTAPTPTPTPTAPKAPRRR